MKKNFNILSLKGLDFDDMEFIKQFNLNANLAYTPELNEAILERAYSDNVKSLIDAGEKENNAKMKAGRERAVARREIEALLKK
jgi:gamma-glutamylcysteine synthetase